MFFRPFSAIQNLVFRQERRPHSFFNLLILAIFVGIVRAILEYLFFGIGLQNAMTIGVSYFYFAMGLGLTFILSVLSKTDWKRAQNAVHIGLFFGIFPPVFDLIFSGFNAKIRYSYYMFWNRDLFPWNFYNPEIAIPLGEALVIWMSIFFCVFYVWIKSKSIYRSILALFFSYTLFLSVMVFFPSLTIRLLVGEITSPASLTKNTAHAVNISTYMIVIWQLVLAIIFYLLIRRKILIILLKRLIHILPFSLSVLLGAVITFEINSAVILTSILLGYVFFVAALQNDYFDYREDKFKLKRKSVITKTDLQFFNISLGAILFWVFLLGHKMVLSLILISILAVLYNYPKYRIKKYFPGALKIEGLWGGLSFLSGMLIFGRNYITGDKLLILFLFYGGWSFVSAWKDLKDIRGDKKAGNITAYIYLLNKGMKLKTIHRLISLIALLCLSVPVVWFGLKINIVFSIILLVSSFLPLVLLSFKTKYKYWFQYILFFISIYILDIIILY